MQQTAEAASSTVSELEEKMMNEIEEGTLDDAVVSTAFAFPHFKFVAKEASERLRVCSLAVNYIEDLADIESSLGKNLAKVSRHETRFFSRPYLSHVFNV